MKCLMIWKPKKPYITKDKLDDDTIERLKWNLSYDEETLVYRGLGTYPPANIRLLGRAIVLAHQIPKK